MSGQQAVQTLGGARPGSRLTRAILVVPAVAAAMLAATACGSGSPGPSGLTASPPAATTGTTATATVAPSASPTGTPAPAIEFTVDGTGPYELGASLTSLQSAGLLSEVTPMTEICVGNTTAKGTGVYKDVNLSFRGDGKLYLAVNRSTKIPTPSGAWLGDNLAKLKIQPDRIVGGHGNRIATVADLNLVAGKK